MCTHDKVQQWDECNEGCCRYWKCAACPQQWGLCTWDDVEFAFDQVIGTLDFVRKPNARLLTPADVEFTCASCGQYVVADEEDWCDDCDADESRAEAEHQRAHAAGRL